MSGFSNPIIGGGGALVYPEIKSPNFQNLPGPAWSFPTSGVPTAKNFMILTTSQASSVLIGQAFTSLLNPGIAFLVSSKSAPAFGFVNIFFGPNATVVMSGDTVTQALQSGWAILKNGNAFFFNIVAQGSITATTFIGTDFVINSAGAFFYNGTPANGNLFCSITSVAGVDALGNSYGSGLNVGNQAGAHLSISTAGDILIANAANLPVAFFYHGDGSLRLYNPAGIAAGNLAIAISPVAGADSAANPYMAGVSAIGTGSGAGKVITLAVNNSNPALSFYSGKPEENEAAFIALDIFNIGLANELLELFIIGPIVNTFTDHVYIGMQSSSADGTALAGGNLQYVDRSGITHNLIQWGEGTVVLAMAADIPAIKPGTTLTAEAWNYVGQSGQPTFGAGWSNRGAGFVGLAFRKIVSPPNSVEIRGWIAVTVATDLTLFTLPAGYRPIGSQTALVWGVTAAAVVQFNIATTGIVAAAGTLPAIGNYYIQTIISLDQ